MFKSIHFDECLLEDGSNARLLPPKKVW